MTHKVLTIAVPSYNVQQYLQGGLESYCRDGADPRLEVIVVDDGSTDDTPQIAQSFAARFPDVFRVVSKPNGGHGSAVNAGIDHARGTYFRIIDGDDRICSQNVAALLDALEAADEDLVVDVKREVTFGTGGSRLFPLPDDIPRACTVPFEQVCLRDDIEACFQIHTLSIRTQLLRDARVRLQEHTFYVDYELVVKVCARARTIRFCDLEVCHYYVGNLAQSVSPANYVRRWDHHERVTRELLRFFAQEPLDPVHKGFVENRVALLVNTHLNIALIFDDDRTRGLRRARTFRRFLAESHPLFHRRSRGRYLQARVLHALGVDAKGLDRLMGRG
ncbi:glycosyltransferase family 2 protein [Eggerthellaceae bacterium zg-997]|nr:glycosyltransferase family 2 protein [Eggerthellaceae bacterium zg-997]